MRPIKHQDINNIEIFEGDTIEFESNKVYLEDDIIDFLKIDKVTAYVVPMNGQVGITLKYRFFSNHVEVYTPENKYNYLLQKHHEKQAEIQKWFINFEKNPDEPIEEILTDKIDVLSFSHQFVHKSKKIIHSTLTDEDKKNYVHKDAFLCYGDNLTAPITQSFLVKLTDEARQRVLDIHGSLYDDEFGYEGHFTHLKLTPEIEKNFTHKFKACPVDDNIKNNFYSVFDSFDKKQEARKAIFTPMKKEIDDWKENNKHLCEIEFNSILKEKMDNLKEKRNEVNNKKFLDKKLEDELFLGFAVSDNLLDYFLSTGCTITLID